MTARVTMRTAWVKLAPSGLKMSAAIGAALALSLSACSATENDDSSATPAATGPSLHGGKAATGKPLKIGFASMESGPVSFPGSRKGADAAMKLINDKLGGINGRPIQLEFCDLQNSTQATQACGQKFAADPSIAFGLTTLNVFGNAGFDSAMAAAGKPVIGAVGITPTDLTDPNAYWIYGGNPSAYGGIGDVVKKTAASEKIDHLSVIHTEGDQSTLNGLKDVQAHLQGSGVSMIKTGVSPGAADYLPAITAAKVTNDSALELALVNPGSCLAAAQDLNKLGITPKIVLASAVCITADVLKANAKLFDNWYFVTNEETVFDKNQEGSDDLKALIEAWDTYEGGGDVASGANLGFGVVLTTKHILEAAKLTDVTGAGVKKAILSYKGHIPLTTANLGCPGPAPYPSMCNTKSVYYESKDGVPALSDILTR